MSYSVAFPVATAATGRVFLPHGYKSDTAKAFLGGVILRRIQVPFDKSMGGAVITVYDGITDAGVPIRSTGLRRYEVTLTAAAGVTGDYNPYGTGVSGFTLPSSRLSLAVDVSGGMDSGASWEGELALLNGCIITFAATAGPAGNLPISVEYSPLESGKVRWDRADSQLIRSGAAS